MIISIHQPEHLPWLGFFHKMYLSDIFVLLDNVQYRKNYFQNRNKIRTKEGFSWVTVPVLTKGKSDQFINQVVINYKDNNWQKRIWNSIKQNYSRSPYFADFGPTLQKIYCESKCDKLVDLNSILIKTLSSWLNIKKEIIISSNLDIDGYSTDLLLTICQKLSADTYLSGKFGKEYLNESKFNNANIKVLYHQFKHPVYKQLYTPFVPEMTAVDILMNHGDKSLNILIEGQDMIY